MNCISPRLHHITTPRSKAPNPATASQAPSRGTAGPCLLGMPLRSLSFRSSSLERFLGTPKLSSGHGEISRSHARTRLPHFRCSASVGAASPSAPAMADSTAGPAPREMLKLRPYEPPHWATCLAPIPEQQLCLAHVPTPIHRWAIPGLPKGTQLFIKRDDLSGMELSGNKVRKLEFLLAEALAQGADSIVTIGGIQSNHCRATAVAARSVGLDTFLILRTPKALADCDPGLVGNLLVERLAGAHVDLVTKEEYAALGSPALGQKLVARLAGEGRRPYLVPVGGSNGVGTWGYIEAVREIEDQLKSGQAGGAARFDHIVMACGSGGTTAGLALGSHLSSIQAKVHAYGVCDSPRYFYDFIQGLFEEVSAGHLRAEDLLHAKDVKGAGYAMSTDEELRTVRDVAQATGIVLDPVYSGKALKGLLDEMRASPAEWEGQSVLFVHTGGLLGMYDKLAQLQPLVGGWRRMDLQ